MFNEVSKHLEVSWKTLGCTSSFNSLLGALDILMKHFPSCLIYYLKHSIRDTGLYNECLSQTPLGPALELSYRQTSKLRPELANNWCPPCRGVHLRESWLYLSTWLYMLTISLVRFFALWYWKHCQACLYVLVSFNVATSSFLSFILKFSFYLSLPWLCSNRWTCYRWD